MPPSPRRRAPRSEWIFARLLKTTAFEKNASRDIVRAATCRSGLLPASIVIAIGTVLLAHATPPRMGDRQESPNHSAASENPKNISTGDDAGPADAAMSGEPVRTPRTLQDWRTERSGGISPDREADAGTPPAPWQPLVLTIAVLGVFLFGARWLQRSLGRRGIGGNRVLEIVARTPLTAKSQAVLVRVGGRAILLGVTSERVSRLGEWTEPGEVIGLTRDGEFANQLRSEEESFFENEVGTPEAVTPTENGNGLTRDSRLASFRQHFSRFSTDPSRDTTDANGGAS